MTKEKMFVFWMTEFNDLIYIKAIYSKEWKNKHLNRNKIYK